MLPSPLPDGVEDVALPSIPEHYGRWQSTVTGGLGNTVRREQLLFSEEARGDRGDGGALFALGAPAEAVRAALAATSDARVGDATWSAAEGHVVEVLLSSIDDAHHVAALVARTGATPVAANPRWSRRLGVERLDRIGASVVTDDTMVDAGQSLHGLRRGGTNWRFSWIPDEWEVPITWDHMVRNVWSYDVADLPMPLRQHAARDAVDRKQFAPIGSRWRPIAGAPRPDELAHYAARGTDPIPWPLHRLVVVPAEEEAKVASGAHDVRVQCDARSYARVGDRWYAPVDTLRELTRHIPARRVVSAALSDAQSKQLLTAFYVATVERPADAATREAARLLLVRYALERGYTARWMGRYDQDADHVGNGETCRQFESLEQYRPANLPAKVLDRLCDADGRVRGRGSKGSRSKYKQPGRVDYVPKRRLSRTRADEDAMRRG